MMKYINIKVKNIKKVQENIKEDIYFYKKKSLSKYKRKSKKIKEISKYQKFKY